MNKILCKAVISVLLLSLICAVFSSCKKDEMSGKYIAEDQYNSDILINSLEFSGKIVQLEVGGDSVLSEYEIENGIFELGDVDDFKISGKELPEEYRFNQINRSSFSLNDIVYVLEDSINSQDSGLEEIEAELSVEEQIDEFIISDEFQRFLDSYIEKAEASGRIWVDAYASGSTLVIEHKYRKPVTEYSKKKVQKYYKKYLNSIYKDKKKRKKFTKIVKSSKIDGIKLKLIVIDSNGEFIAEKNFI